MERILDYIVNMDAYLAQLVDVLGPWAYGAVAAVIFAETGLVVTPWLPGESLLLTSGTLAGSGIVEVVVLAPLLFAAAFLGDVSNYLIGRFIGRYLLRKPRRYLKPEHVAQAHEFYERHGGAAILFARFLPIVRTLAPFVAGVAGMEIHKLMFFAASASAVWVTIFLGAGYWFGTVPWVQEYLAVGLAIAVAVSVTPGFIAYVVHHVRKKRAA
ncbi:MAG TPA: VTT domain-containing protein [Thermoleophilia bacterium]|nr:VTT domain-containing protein [Thermoleophilia bacterium]HQG04349.1 VTT domain-containing protein [Thermoleophilia bacterium]HQG54867.1 VTT domain-containing protein [Thermoleophilia bacterium]HQJ97885.1 VTT domain-containing protein [Thermoleophilia bacterium]